MTDPNPTVQNVAITAGARIDWGDGTSSMAPFFTVPPPAGASFVTLDGDVFTVVGDHVYNQVGTFGITVTAIADFSLDITQDQGGVGHAQAVVADAQLLAPLTPMPGLTATQGVGFRDRVISDFTDPGGPSDPGTYIATIDWGDGSSVSQGVVDYATGFTPPAGGTPAGAVAPDGKYQVAGSHLYAGPGAYLVHTAIRSQGGSVVTTTSSIAVFAQPVSLTGALSAASDSGISHSDAITNVQQPVFFGLATPGSTVVYTAQGPGGAAIPIGQAATDASGFYSLQTIPILADGSYTITAQVRDAFGSVSQTAQILPINGGGPLVVDTVGPRVEAVRFDRVRGTLTIGLQDDRSGMDRTSVIDGGNYSFKSRSSTSLNLRATGLSAPVTSASAYQTVTLTYNKGKTLKRGVYTLDIRSGGIEDVAGNALDGEFYGFFPSGNGRPGGDFVAQLISFHLLTRAPEPVNGFASPNSPPGTRPKTTKLAPTTGTTAKPRHVNTVGLTKMPKHASAKTKGPATMFGKGK